MASNKEPASTSTPGSCESKPRDRNPLRAISLFREDFGNFKQDLIKIFKDKDANAAKQEEKSSLDVLKEEIHQFREDLGHFKDNISGVVKKGLRKQEAFKIKAQEQNGEKEQSCDDVSAESREMVEEKELNQEPLGKELDLNVDSDEVCGDTSQSGVTDEQSGDGEEVSLKPLSSLWPECSVLQWNRNFSQTPRRISLRDDVWAMKNYAQYLTLDPNTANSELLLSDGNRKARRVWGKNHVTDHVTDHMTDQLIDHPERFELCPQVLCREGLLDTVYWEVEWTGGADLGVTYNSIMRSGSVCDGLLGQNQGSWSLECSECSYTPCHRQRRYRSICPDPFSHKVGIFLDFEAGSLTFYCVSPESMVHLHTFTCSFTEPLYPGFCLWAWGGSVSLSQVELHWERLLQ